MAGPQANLSSMWVSLCQTLALDPPVPSCKNTYLGCNQQPIIVDANLVREKQKMMQQLLKSRVVEHILNEEELSIALTNGKWKVKEKAKPK